jgi:uncharacterized protein YcfL
MVVRCFGGVIVVLVLLAGCSSTPVSPVYDDAGLLAAEEEIAELKAQLKEQTKSSDGTTASVPTTAPVSPVYDDAGLLAAEEEIAELKAQLKEQTKSSDSTSASVPTTEATEIFETWKVPTTGHSEGPCGVFTLNGTRILKLEYDHVDGPYQWVDSGVDYIQMLLDHYEFYEGETWIGRPPDVAFALRVTENRNHFFGFQWNYVWAVLPELADVGFGRDISGIVGANHVKEAGFFGLDENCEWDWISITAGGGTHDYGSQKVGNSGFSFEDRDSHGWWLTEFEWKDYSCEEAPPPGSIATYDPKKHMFISKCKDGS